MVRDYAETKGAFQAGVIAFREGGTGRASTSPRSDLDWNGRHNLFRPRQGNFVVAGAYVRTHRSDLR